MTTDTSSQSTACTVQFGKALAMAMLGKENLFLRIFDTPLSAGNLWLEIPSHQPGRGASTAKIKNHSSLSKSMFLRMIAKCEISDFQLNVNLFEGCGDSFEFRQSHPTLGLSCVDLCVGLLYKVTKLAWKHHETLLYPSLCRNDAEMINTKSQCIDTKII